MDSHEKLFTIALCIIAVVGIYMLYQIDTDQDRRINKCKCTCLPYQIRHCKKDSVSCYSPDGGLTLIEFEEQD